MSSPENTLKQIIERQNRKIDNLQTIMEMIVVKLDHLDSYVFPDPENETFNLNTKRDWAKNEFDFTQQIMDKLKENLK